MRNTVSLYALYKSLFNGIVTDDIAEKHEQQM
jgi:hypothetical protein